MELHIKTATGRPDYYSSMPITKIKNPIVPPPRTALTGRETSGNIFALPDKTTETEDKLLKQAVRLNAWKGNTPTFFVSQYSGRLCRRYCRSKLTKIEQALAVSMP